MEWNVVVNLIEPSLLIVVAACWVLGFVMKQTPRIPDWSIVYIVTLLAILFVVFMQGLTVAAVLQGIICGAVAVYSNQLVKQARKGSESHADHPERQ